MTSIFLKGDKYFMHIENNSCICTNCPWQNFCRANINSEYTRKTPYFTKDMAVAMIGGENINGVVTFKDVPGGTEVKAIVNGLPDYKPAEGSNPQIGPHGFHIHSMGKCQADNQKDPFKTAGMHYNPDNQPHGNHAGDFPVLFSNNGKAEMTFFTNKFKVKDIIGKSVIIHENPDDFKTQPAGNSGKRIACGVIMAQR